MNTSPIGRIKISGLYHQNFSLPIRSLKNFFPQTRKSFIRQKQTDGFQGLPDIQNKHNIYNFYQSDIL